MASLRELVELFNQGSLGRMLAERFKGQRGYAFPNEDSDHIISFERMEDVPGVAAIRAAVKAHYEGKGYTVEEDDTSSGERIFCAFVFHGNKDQGYVQIFISTGYRPTTGNKPNIQITSTICV